MRQFFCWKRRGNEYIYTVIYFSAIMKKGFTLIEMVIVLVVIWILMAATMKFWSGRIVDLKAQSLKEDFIGWYNEIYSQNMTSSFRDGTKYTTLTVGFQSWVWYEINWWAPILADKLSSITFRALMIDGQESDIVHLQITPYILGCFITSSRWTTGDVFAFQTYIPENGKQYCFEILSETCKLIETRCAD